MKTHLVLGSDDLEEIELNSNGVPLGPVSSSFPMTLTAFQRDGCCITESPNFTLNCLWGHAITVEIIIP